MRQEVKLRMYNIIAKPTLQCGSEPWIPTEEDNRRTQTEVIN
jgi:hypothetical protein